MQSDFKTFSQWKRKQQPTPVSLPGKSHGQRGAWWAIIHGITKGSGMTLQLNNKLDFKKAENSLHNKKVILQKEIC